MSTPARRTRTGCKTCRQRKLKCDEVKPVCGQCRKSSRECQPSEGIAFRHAQNAGFTEENGKEDLANFYKYRQKFNNTYFLPVPKDLSFIHVTDPYADEPPPQSSSHVPPQLPMQEQHPQYVDVAATGLKAMIDPSLEDHTSTEIKLESAGVQGIAGPSVTSDEVSAREAENFNETIMKALRDTDEQTQNMAQP